MKVDIFLSYHKIILPSVLVFSFLYSTFTVPSYLAKKLSGSLVGCSKKKLRTFSLQWNGIWTRLFFQSKNVYKKDALFVLQAKRYTHRISKYDNKWGETFFEWNTYCTIGHVSERAVWFFHSHSVACNYARCMNIFLLPLMVAGGCRFGASCPHHLHLLQLWKWFLGETIGE